MTLRVRLPALLLAFLLVAASAVAAKGDDRDRPSPADSKSHREADDDEEKDEERGGPRVGRFDAPRQPPSSGSTHGRFVSFDWTATAVRNFTVNGSILFHVVADGDPVGREGGSGAEGAQIRVVGSTYRLHAHDNPVSPLKIDADGPITFRLVEGAAAELEDDHVRVTFPGGLVGLLFGGKAAVAGGEVRFEDRARFLLEQPLAPFDKERKKLSEAAAKKHLGAEATLGAKGKRDVVTFANVSLSFAKLPGNGTNVLQVLVDGHGFDGRVVVLNVDGSLFGAEASDRLDVLFDNATIPEASNVTDVLDPDDDGILAEYWLSKDKATGGFQLIVSVPHYSVHSITVQSALLEGPVSIVLGVVAAGLVLAVAVAVMFRPPRP